MVSCPACGSSRIRNDYKPAPAVLRIFFIRALLCDYCNRQFKAFSLREPRNRGRRHSSHKPAVMESPEPTPTPTVDLSRLKEKIEGVKQSESMVQSEPPQRLTINLAALMLQSKTQQEVSGAIVEQNPRTTDLRTEITRLYAQGVKEKEQGDRTSPRREQSAETAMHICTHCGSSDVKKRHRTVLEKLAFSVTDHKAFTCRSCGETFYSKSEDDRGGAIGATEALR
jgi:rubrerythrin